MSDSPNTCPSCGARLPAGADVCDLCGTPVDESAASADDETPDTEAVTSDAEDSRASAERPEASGDEQTRAEEGVYCNECGWKNPPGARYCSRCGAKLQDLSSEATPVGARGVDADLPAGSAPSAAESGEKEPASTAADSGEDAEQQAMGQRIAMLVGVAAIVVAGLFFVTLWSQSRDWGGGADEGSAAGAQAQQPAAQRGSGPASASPGAAGTGASIEELVAQNATELPPEIAARADSLKARVEEASSADRQQERQKLVNLYIGAGHLGRAAAVQEAIAQTSDAPEDWRRTADLLYSWMEQVRQQEGGAQAMVSIAHQAVSAYEKVLSKEPDNLEVRTDMATVLLQTNNPMRGVQEINRVLEQDSTFIPARFNKGIMLAMIGRTDDAVAQFETVKEIAGPESPYYQQADQAIQAIESRGQGAGTMPPAQDPGS